MQQNEENRKRYHWYKNHHICVKCGQAEAAPNRTKCDSCLEKDRKRHRENWDNVRDVRNIYAKNRRIRNKSKGMCAKCGAKPLWDTSTSMCYDCMIVQRNATRRWKEPRKLKWRESGLCVRCGGVRKPGYKVCRKCYDILYKQLDYARTCISEETILRKKRVGFSPLFQQTVEVQKMQELIDFRDPYLNHVLPTLLKDRTTGKNIIWATDPTPENWCCFSDEITLEQVENIRPVPRVQKRLAEQKARTRKKAEVFTPTWVCEKMVNLAEKNLDADDWEKFINKTCLEVTCGEAPFLVSRYDTVTGEQIPVPDRIGLLDRKLRAISKNIRKYPNRKNGLERMEWVYNRDKCGYGALYFSAALRAFSSTYGYEWQGDNLLLARANLLLTYCEHWRQYFKKEPIEAHIEIIAQIVSWNIWQMDGLKNTVPGTDIPCKIYDWKENKAILFGDVGKEDE